MRKYFKQFLALLLALSMCVPSVAAIGADSSTETEEQAPALTYAVVNSPNLTPPDTQEILIGIGDENSSVSQAVLTIRNEDTGETTDYAADELTSGAALFRMDYSTQQSGTYVLDSIGYICNGFENTVAFADLDIHAAFGVNAESTSEPDAVVSEDTSTDVSDTAADVVFDVTTIDNGGDETLASAVENALYDAASDGNESGISTFSMDGVSTYSTERSKDVVVVLDPGHGTRRTNTSVLDQGTSFSYNGQTYYEKDLTLKIAQYCKTELESYSGVKVYLTRTGDVTDHAVAIKDRVDLAKSYGADILVSIHLNSDENSNAEGAEVFYPNANGSNGAVSADAKKLSELVLKQLVSLGLRNRGVKIRNANDDKYSDGSAMDYLGINRYSKEYGFPGILIEHAFLDNTSDFHKYLSDDSKLRKLGIADATGIANYLGLSKSTPDTPVVAPSSSLTASQDLSSGQLSLSLSDASSSAKSVLFYVWSAENGQDDMRTYNGVKQSNGAWTASAPLNQHKGYGDYYVHCYVQDSQGWHFSSGTTVKVQKLTASAEAVTTSTSTGAFNVNVSDVNLPDAVKQIRIAVWTSANGQDDLIWTNATKSGNTWSISVDPASHKNESGDYNIHVYALDTIGNWYAVRCINHTVSIAAAPKATMSAAWNQSAGQLSLTLSNYSAPSNLKQVRFAVWSLTNGQDDLVWYTANRQSDGTYTYSVPLNKHATYGTYAIHCYATTTSGSSFVAGASIDVPKITATATASVTDSNTGNFRVNVTGINAPSAISAMRIAVWSDANGQDDLIWTDATKNGNDWYIDVNTSDHNYDAGNYNIHVYVRDTTTNGWYAARCINHTVSVSSALKASVSASWNQGAGQLNLTLSNYRAPSNLKQVRFAVWSLTNGQDDLVWYTANRQSDGTYTYSVPLNKHATYGTYAIHCYATTTSGSSFVAGASIDVPKITATATASVTDSNTGNFRVNVTGINAPSAISAMRIAVWSDANGQDDLIWTNATKNGNDWYIDVNTYDHGYDTGNYNIHIYVKDTTTNSWYAARCITHSVSIGNQKPALTATWDAANSQLNVKLTGCLLAKDVGVRFAVWSAENGQDDLAWYTATRQSDGSWTYTVPLSKHRSYGEYYIHCYSTANRFLAGATTTVSKVTASATATTTNDLNGNFRITVQDVNQPDAIKEMRIAVWSSANGQDDLIWKTATRQGNNWYLDVSTSEHKYDTGTYCIHIYVRDALGGWYAVRCINQTVNIPQVEAKLAVSMDSNTDYMNITLSNALVDASSSSIRFAVWSSRNGQDDLVWYTASYDAGARTFKYRVPMSEHNYDTGVYMVHCYYYHGSTQQMLAGTTITPYTGTRQTSAEISSATANTIWQYFRNKGLSEAGTAALMGNLYAESGLNPRLLEKGKLPANITTDTYNEALENGTYLYSDYTNMRDSFSHDSAGYGLAQWTFYTRKQALYDYAQQRGTSLNDLNMQLDFLWQELTRSYPTVASALKTATSVKAASDIVLTQYERPANQDNSVKERRANYGRAYFGYYA